METRSFLGRLGHEVGEALTPAVDLAFPPRCALCGDAIAAQTGLCIDCWATLAVPGEPSCRLCQRPLATGPLDGEPVCAPCLADAPRHNGIAAATLYNESSRQLVLSFKHGRRLGLAPVLARLMAARLPTLEGNWILIPVPLHRLRLWKRGYNQAVLLASGIARLRGLPLLREGLIRRKSTPSLGGLGKRARAKVLTGALAVNKHHSETIRGANIILVDDVLTSGATSDACIKALKKAGANKIMVSCFARVMDEALDNAHHAAPNTDLLLNSDTAYENARG
ncbi:Competence protein [Alteripontixanthobacter maritimus]|uniref:Competence protein n=1 Tax=Alteripontixanthobacter maritimus TaxID=2161824 RepID=A0A369QCA9_9SPHN|nr:ComF family protein [Alteripontixanthobacter maritimus]RDC59908.1 Competence protein [Alteripontixanthobacter maritimus]